MHRFAASVTCREAQKTSRRDDRLTFKVITWISMTMDAWWVSNLKNPHTSRFECASMTLVFQYRYMGNQWSTGENEKHVFRGETAHKSIQRPFLSVLKWHRILVLELEGEASIVAPKFENRFAPQHLRDLPAELDHLKGNPQNWSSIESRSRPHFPTYNASRNASTTSVQEVEQSRLRLNTVEAYQSCNILLAWRFQGF